MEFVGKSERICERGRLLALITCRYPRLSEDTDENRRELAPILEKAAGSFFKGCKENASDTARKTGKCVKASFVCDERLNVQIEVTLGGELLVHRDFMCE